jgi:glycosyltransferase involved in cell wall biosynthesis
MSDRSSSIVSAVETVACGDVTVVIPSIPPRREMLQRALNSVLAQTCPPRAISVMLDHNGDGACATRNAGLATVQTEWVAFLDDDDEFLPNHIGALLATAHETGAALVFPRWEGINRQMFRAFWRPFDEPMRDTLLRTQNFIPVTVLARVDALRAVGGFEPPPGHDPATPVCEDWGCWIKLLNAGYTFAHHPQATWRWNGHPGHTAGHSWRR